MTLHPSSDNSFADEIHVQIGTKGAVDDHVESKLGESAAHTDSSEAFRFNPYHIGGGGGGKVGHAKRNLVKSVRALTIITLR